MSISNPLFPASLITRLKGVEFGEAIATILFTAKKLSNPM
jgi:hypothetical protein